MFQTRQHSLFNWNFFLTFRWTVNFAVQIYDIIIYSREIILTVCTPHANIPYLNVYIYLSIYMSSAFNTINRYSIFPQSIQFDAPVGNIEMGFCCRLCKHINAFDIYSFCALHIDWTYAVNIMHRRFDE